MLTVVIRRAPPCSPIASNESYKTRFRGEQDEVKMVKERMEQMELDQETLIHEQVYVTP